MRGNIGGSSSSIPLGTYTGHGKDPDNNEVTYTVVLHPRRLCWLDYKCELPHSTEAWHSEGSFVVEARDDGSTEVLKYTIGGLPGQGRAGKVFEFTVQEGLDGARVLERDGVRCQPQADTFSQQPERKTCAKCSTVIAGQSLTHGGLAYHKECFTCDTCNSPLVGAFSRLSDGRKQCEGCAKKKFCEACHKVLSSKMTNFGGKLYHPECFTCSSCSIALSGEIFTKGDQLLCKACVGTAKTGGSRPNGKPAAAPPGAGTPKKPEAAEVPAAAPAAAAPAAAAPAAAAPTAAAAGLQVPGARTPAEASTRVGGQASPKPASPRPCEVPLGSYGGKGNFGGCDVTYMVRLMERGKAWLDHTSSTRIDTTSWHAEGTYSEVRPDGGAVQVLHFTVDGCPFGTGPQAGRLFEIFVEEGGVLICEGIRCPKAEEFDVPGSSVNEMPADRPRADSREIPAGSFKGSAGRTFEAVSGSGFASSAVAKEEEAPAAALLPDHPSDLPEGCYSLEELQNPLVWKAKGVDATKREEYLTDEVFTQLFGMTKVDFAKMPKWKRDGRKREHGLF